MYYGTHKMSDSVEYSSYNSMKQRVLNPRNKRFKDYGERGIKICDRWLKSFENFYADMGSRPDGTTLERRNNDGNYEPDNCYWAIPKEQMNNTRRNVYLTYLGKRLSVSQWSREIGLQKETIYARIRRGWSIDQILLPDSSHAHKRPQPVRTRNTCVVPDCGRPTRAYQGEFCKRHSEARRHGRKLVVGYVPPKAKIDAAKAAYLRSDGARQRSKPELAQEFGISIATINDIRRGVTWRNASNQRTEEVRG
jgi:hypothetical protein